MLNKAIIVLESELKKMEGIKACHTQDWVDSIEKALSILKSHIDYESDLDEMYRDYLSKL